MRNSPLACSYAVPTSKLLIHRLNMTLRCHGDRYFHKILSKIGYCGLDPTAGPLFTHTSGGLSWFAWPALCQMLFLTADCRRATFLFVHHGFEVGAALQLECVSSEWWCPKTVKDRRGGCVGRWRCQASVVRAIWASGIKSEIPFQFQF